MGFEIDAFGESADIAVIRRNDQCPTTLGARGAINDGRHLFCDLMNKVVHILDSLSLEKTGEREIDHRIFLCCCLDFLRIEFHRTIL